MESKQSICVSLYKSKIPYEIFLTSPTNAEDVIINISKHLDFRPISLNLFSLRDVKNPTLWLPLSYKFEPNKGYQIEFRMRFKLPSMNSLNRFDENAFDYAFHQIRHDLLHGNIPEFCLEAYKPQALGLCTTDMIRVILEENLSRDEVLSNYKHYVPKNIYKQHFPFLKKKIKENISKFLPNSSDGRSEGASIKYIKEQYVIQAEELSRRYLAEEFTAFKEDEYPTTLRIDPYDTICPGLSMSYVGKQNWEHLCSIEDVCFISMRGDCTVEISRKNGIPISFKFKHVEVAISFISLLDGYYRLSEKWSFNLCKEVFTPSLAKLKALKCHGPVGQKFAHQKLSTHPSTKKGWFILRQSSNKFGEYVIDCINENKSRPLSKDIISLKNDTLQLCGSTLEFNSISELLMHFISSPEPGFQIKDCLPPSEYDRSPLLLCKRLNDIHPSNLNRKTKSELVNISGPTTPQLISPRTLQVYRGKKFELEGKMCKVIKAIWNQSDNVSCFVAIKLLKREFEEGHMKDLLELANTCVLWQSDSLVGLKGVVLGNPQALVLEWMPYGPFDQYLQENSLLLKSNELIESASHIAKALWFLDDHGIVHGNIRCHNVLVYEHSQNGLIVKLSDPGITELNIYDIHWIPPEFYEIPGFAKKFSTADIWATATTLWEIFSHGKKPPNDSSPQFYKGKYLSGWRLPKPDKCPTEIFRIISECWAQTPDTRKQPQAIVRDIHQILYQLIGSKRSHFYTPVSPASSETGNSTTNSLFDVSDNLNWTTFGSDLQNPTHGSSDGTLSTFIHDLTLNSSSTLSNATQNTWLFHDNNGGCQSPDLISGFSEVYTNGSITTAYSIGSAIGIYEFKNNEVTLCRVIGQGFYGSVYLGEITKKDGFKEHVAVKQIKKNKDIQIETNTELDFRREFEILQKLSHQNIVELKGVVYEPDLLLIIEYIPLGSLLEYFKLYGREPSRQQLLKFSQDVAEGMAYLSSNNIVHRDLAARNLLVADDNLVKISDFGLARFTDNDNCYTLRTRRHFPIKWYPPESIEYGKFSEQSDVWSYGVTMYEMFSYGDDPLLPGLSTSSDTIETDNIILDDMLKLLKRGCRLPCPLTCPQPIYTNLMLPCWEIEPQNRPNFRKIVEDLRHIEFDTN